MSEPHADHDPDPDPDHDAGPDPVLDAVAAARTELGVVVDHDPEEQLPVLEQVHEQLRRALAAGESGPDLSGGR